MKEKIDELWEEIKDVWDEGGNWKRLQKVIEQLIIASTQLPKRNEEELDSISYGTPKTGQLKIYFNSKIDTADELKRRVALAAGGIGWANKELG